MKLLNVSAPILDRDDKPVMFDADTQATIGQIINVSLDQPKLDANGRDQLTGDDKRKRWNLSLRIALGVKKSAPVTISFDEEKLIREAIDLHPSILVVGRVNEALDMAEPAHKAKANGSQKEARA